MMIRALEGSGTGCRGGAREIPGRFLVAQGPLVRTGRRIEWRLVSLETYPEVGTTRLPSAGIGTSLDKL